jgi:hypothetical protein
VRKRDAFLSPHGLVALRRLARLAEEEISRLTSPVSRRKVLRMQTSQPKPLLFDETRKAVSSKPLETVTIGDATRALPDELVLQYTRLLHRILSFCLQNVQKILQQIGLFLLFLLLTTRSTMWLNRE